MKKILIIQTAFIGDAILTLPLIQKANEKLSNQIDVLAIPSTAEYFNASKYVNKVIVYEKRGAQKSLPELIKLGLKLRRNNYDIIYSVHRSARTSLLVLLANAKESVGFNNSALKLVYSRLIKYEKNQHEVKRNLSLLAPQTEESWKIKPEIEFSDKTKLWIDEEFKKFKNNKLIGIAPGSVWDTKKYPIEFYTQIADMLIQRGFKIILFGSKADIDLCELISTKFPEYCVNTAGVLNLIESTYLMSKCELILSNDSAPTHMAQAAGTNVLTLFTSTVPTFGFYPYIHGSAYLSYDELDCKPCGIHGHKKCPINTFDCGHKLKPKMVFEFIEEHFWGKQ